MLRDAERGFAQRKADAGAQGPALTLPNSAALVSFVLG